MWRGTKTNTMSMESQTTEYKQQWSDKHLAYISGFANAQGGTLYIGLADTGEVLGIENAKFLLENLPNKAIQATGVIPDINIHSQNGKEYISIHIKPSDQPISCNGKYYMRSGSTLQELNGNALTNFLMRQKHATWDMHIEPDATLDDIDPEAVRYFINFAIDAKRLNESAKHESVEHILRNLKLINKQGQLTFAALMLFGKDIEEYCLSASFRIGRFGASQADLIFDDNIVCPLIRMPEKVMQTLRSRYLVAPINYQGLRRIEPLEIPEDALREMICNAIVHKDYRGTFIQMRVWDNYVELWNSGTFPPEITPANLMTLHESHPRNNLIAKVFYLAGFIESWGRGYEKIRKAFAEQNLQTPLFEQVRGGVLATIQREIFISLNQQVGAEGVGESVGDDGQNGGCNTADNEIINNKNGGKIGGDGVGDLSVMELSERQKKIMNLIQQFPSLPVSQMSVFLTVKRSTIEKELTLLKKQGIISRKRGKFIIEEHGRDTHNQLPDASNVATSKGANMATSKDANMATSKGANMATSKANVATSKGASMATSKDANMATSKGTNMATSKGASMATSRLSREKLQVLIISNCKEWISLDDLSIRIKRTPKYLRNDIIPQMLASKKLQMLYPSTPNHPNQKYKVTD